MSQVKSLTAIAFLFVIICFQNCAKISFSPNNSNQDFFSGHEYEPEVILSDETTNQEDSTPPQEPAPVKVLAKAWTDCDGDFTRIGQLEPAPGLSCTDVCASVGKACLYRAAQGDYNACFPANPPQTGLCSTLSYSNSSWQCVCQ